MLAVADDRDAVASAMLMRLIARRAGVSYTAATAAYRRYLDDGGETLHFTLGEITDPARSYELCEEIGKRLDIGIFRIKRRIAERAAPPKPRERRMSSKGHPYVRGVHGRSVRTIPGGHHVATQTCRCGNSHDINFRELAASDQMDRKFIQAGWHISPAKCPTCINKPKETAVAAANPSPAAIRANVTMFRLLGLHFDAEAGTYAKGWSDDAVAKEADVSPAMVAGVREEAFGPLKEPAEIAALAADIATVDAMLIEAAQTFKTLETEVATLKARMVEVRKKFGA